MIFGMQSEVEFLSWSFAAYMNGMNLSPIRSNKLLDSSSFGSLEHYSWTLTARNALTSKAAGNIADFDGLIFKACSKSC